MSAHERFKIWKALNKCNTKKCGKEQKAVNDAKAATAPITGMKDIKAFMQSKPVVERNACLLKKCGKQVADEVAFLANQTAQCLNKPVSVCKKLNKTAEAMKKGKGVSVSISAQDKGSIEARAKVYSKLEVESLKFALSQTKRKKHPAK